MNISENEFFRKATTRICGTLDIDRSMSECADFLKDHIPLDGLFLYFFELRPSVMKIISQYSLDGSRQISPTISMPENTRPFVEWPEDANIRCINQEGQDPIAKTVSKSLRLPEAPFWQ